MDKIPKLKESPICDCIICEKIKYPILRFLKPKYKYKKY